MANPNNLGAASTEGSGNLIIEALKGDRVSASLAGWGIIAIVLFSAAEFDSTAPLAAAFAWLIFVAVLLFNGEKLLAGKPAPTNKRAV